ncbi:MAG: type II toxin-antitoxin system RelE/ParE family toxin [Acidobacteria bacterium]|nr:type II toxin-antitoxin system RelE/ParE family toxin [Acidobacteriota bacterium]
MRLEFSPWVEGDLDAIAGYIALDSPRHAAAFLQEIRAELRVVARNPLFYRLRPEIGKDARVAVVGQYVILFRVMEKTVRVERIVYGGRDLPELLKE